MHEGGIRTPMLARWPTKIAKGSISNHISAFWDVLPTMSQLVWQPVPEQSDGISFMPTLLNQDAQPKHDYMYWEFTKGNEQKLFSQAIRKEKWKAYLEVEKPMEILNLEEDPYEQNDLAADMPEMVAEINAIIAVAHTPLQTKQ